MNEKGESGNGEMGSDEPIVSDNCLENGMEVLEDPKRKDRVKQRRLSAKTKALH